MPEETVEQTIEQPTETTEQPAATETQAAPTILESGSLFNEDGTFVDEWWNSDKLPEDIRGNEALKVIKNPIDLAKRTVNAEKMVGKNKIALPGKNAKPEEWQKFFDDIGNANPEFARPKTPEEYRIDIPEGFQELYSDERIANMKQIAHQLGLNQKQVDGYIQAELESVAKAIDAQQAEEDRLRDEANLALKKEFGAAYDERIHVANRLIAESFGGNKEQQLQFLQKYGNDPDFIKFAANVGAKLVESKSLVAELTQQTPSEALAKIRELESDERYMNMGSDMTKEERAQHAEKIREQYQLVYPERQRSA